MGAPFIFKQFTIHQDRSSMKVGTDGVLLGAWASVDNQPNTILDIGTGTGLIALQMAQRTSAELIDAIELDDETYEQCVANFEESPWSDRLFCYHADFMEFVDEVEDNYDLIISNPPFYEEEVTSGNSSRDRARQTKSLPFDELLGGVAKLLSHNGLFAVILPFKEERRFLEMGKRSGLYPKRITRVKGSPSAEIKRSMLEMRFSEGEPKVGELVIELARHQYTKAYSELTSPFYLKM
ncbi:methyltransferase [Muricauda sp. JGD-17]|uniref:tRNA1(Val) (adenine(37)-N6)-methyltransferase n=1 Tax=Flagellimonas ochracea TaxID=2696472 RepID=A0A964WYC6_9FLAO|nr:methyltransferase [Allomuricauda ochracea]NAY92678.1 methyltransferase [Allomuricauda ochracea]